jgi:hypothetical protein
MEESIGNASMRAMAWAERTVLLLSPLAEKVTRRMGTQAFTFRDEVSSPNENMNAPTIEDQELVPNELPHVMRQTHIQKLHHRQVANRDPDSMSAASAESRHGNRTILPAPAQNTNLITKLQGRKAEDQSSDKVAAKVLPGKRSEPIPYIDIGKVADRVYNLMRHDLILERERTTRLGG